MPESRIVWVRNPAAFPWVRVTTDLVPTRAGWRRKPNQRGDQLIGYAEASSDVPSSNRRFKRRYFYLRDTDYPFGDHYLPKTPGRPSEAVDPLTLSANREGELTERSVMATADLEAIHEVRSDLSYDQSEGVTYLVLRRPTERAETEPCGFCGLRHTHGREDGHRVAHCLHDRAKDVVIALDGTKLRRQDGYIVRTVAGV